MSTILICHNFNSFSYAANSVALAHELAAAGHRVIFLSHERPELTGEEPANLTVLCWPGKRPVGWQAFRFVWRIIKQHKVDSLLAHAAAFNIAGLAGWLRGVPQRFGYYHSIYASTVVDNNQSDWLTWIKKWRKRFFIHRYTRIVCVSKHAAGDVQHHFRVPAGKCTVVYNSLADRGTDPITAKSHTSPVLFFLPTRLDPGKNIEAVMDGFLLFQQTSVTPARLLIAGAGVQESLIQQKAAATHGTVSYLGLIPYPLIDGHISSAHFVVCSTLHEAFGMVNIEAMMLGTPVLANATGGIPELIEDNKNGLLVTGYTAQDWAAAFAKATSLLLQQPAQYESLRRQAREDFCTRFLLEHQIQVLKRLLLGS